MKVFYPSNSNPNRSFFLFKRLLPLALFFCSFTLAYAGTITSTATGGSWAAGGTWVGGAAPAAGDDVVIADGATVLVTASPGLTFASLTVGQGASGVLAYNTTTSILLFSGNVTITAFGTIRSGSAGTVTHTLSIGGDFVNNGTYNCNVTATNRLQTNFTGASNNSFTTSASAVTSFHLIQLNKGTSNTNMLDFNPSNTVSFPATGALTITNGTFKLNGSVTISSPVLVAAYTIPATGGFWLNNANATVTGQSTAIVAGNLRVSQGIYNVTTTTAINSGAAVLVDGGTLNLTGAVTMAAAAETLTVTSGTCGLGGALTIGANAGAVVLVNGGTLTTVGAVTASGKLQVTSGTCTIGTTLTATNALSTVIVDGGILNVNSATAGTVASIGGSFQLSAGSFNVGTAANTNLALSASVNFSITGGTMNVAGRFGGAAANTASMTYNQSNGTVYVATLGGSNSATLGSFDLGTAATTSFTLSGGKIVVAQGQIGAATNLDFRGPAAGATYATAGTGFVQFGTPALAITPAIAVTATTTTFRITQVLPTTILNADNDPGIAQAGDVTVFGNMTLNGAGGYTNGTNFLSMRGNSATNPGNITVSGTNAFSFTSALAADSLAFSSKWANQQFNLGASGTIAGNQIGSLKISNTFSTAVPLSRVILPNNLAMLNASTLTLTAGILQIDTLTMGVTGPVTLLPASVTAASYVEGVVKRTFSATTNSATANTTLFPVGKNNLFLPINLGPTISASPVQLQAEVFTTGTGTNVSPLIAETYAHFWQASNTSATPANLTSLLMREVDATVAAGNLILKSSTNGTLSYQRITPASTASAGVSVTSAAITNAEFTANNYYSFGTGCAANAVITGAINICIGASSQLISTNAGTWSSANPAVATVDASGNVTGVTAGTVNIIFTDNSGGACTGTITNYAVTIINCSAVPGGVGNNLVSWYKGDNGLSLDLKTWTDQVGTNHLTGPTTVAGCNSLSYMNFNPAAHYDAGNQSLFYQTPSTSCTGWWGNRNDVTVFAVAKTLTATVNVQGVWVKGTVYLRKFGSLSKITIGGGSTNATSPKTWADFHPHLVRSGVYSPGLYIAADGENETTLSTASNSTGIVSSQFLIGYSSSSDYWAAGDIPEVIIFNGKQTAADYNKVQSYLALKYGISLDQTTAQDYIASDGTTKMWDTSAAATGFNNNIFGIGRDNAAGSSELDQKISQSGNTANLFTVATINDFIVNNQDVSRTSLSNLNFETFADNNGANTWTFTGAKPGYKILSRQWQVQETGTIGTVYVQFDTATVPARGDASLPFYILTDPNADGDYSDGTLTPLTNSSGSLWTSAFDFTNGIKFTLATSSPYAGVDTTVCSGGSKLYDLTGVFTTGTWSADPANPAGATVGSTTAGVATVDFTSATFGIYHFIYTIAGATDTMQIIYSDCKAPGGVRSGLNVWIKANAGVTGVTPISGWANQVLNGVPILLNGQPNLDISANTYNFNPFVNFEGTATPRQYITLDAQGDTSLLLNGAIFAAANLTDLSRVWTHLITGVGTLDGTSYGSLHGGLSGSNQAALQATGGDPDFANNWRQNGLSVPENQVHLTLPNIISTVADPGGVTANDRLFGGQSGIPNRDWKGPVAEFFSYNRTLSTTERNQVESYLALKYGITLDQSTARNYIASDVAINMWNATAAATGFDKDIFGIGRDDSSALNQKVSQSVNSDGTVLTIATDNNFTASNQDAARTTSLADLNFETIANDNGAATWTASGAPTGYQRLTRQWQVQETGTIGTVYAQFDTANAIFAIPPRINTGSPFYIITDPNADGNYTDGVAIPLTNTSASFWSTAIDFANGAAFTIATQLGKPDAGIDRTTCLGSAAITIAGTNPATGVWTEQTGNPAGVTLSGSVNGIATAQFTTTGVYHFIYTTGATDTLQVTVNTCTAAPGGVMSNLALWMKAGVGTNTTTGGDSVTTWNDQVNAFPFALDSSIGGHDPATAVKPQYVENAVNYNPGVDYSSSYMHRLSIPAIAPKQLNSTMYLAGRLVNPVDYNTTWMTSPNGGKGGTNEWLMEIKFGNLGYYSVNGSIDAATTLNWAQNAAALTKQRYETGNTDVYSSLNGSAEQTLNNVLTNPALINDNHRYFTLGTDNNLAGYPFGGYITETFVYQNGTLGATETQKIESYLALKYGVTINSSGPGSGNYLLSNGTTAWDAGVNPSHHNQVIGIVRDDASGLIQKQSHTQDDSLKVFVGSLAATNQANGGTIGTDLSSIIIGNDGGRLQGLGGAKPAGIYSMLSRSWKITNTNFGDTYSIEVTWDSVNTFSLSDIRLLVSATPDFSGATIVNAPDVSFALGSIIVGGIGTSVIPANSTRYITIGSISASTSLPIDLVAFTATAIGTTSVKVDWKTSSETNNDHFTVQRSANSRDWVDVATVKGAGTTTIEHRYSITDNNPITGKSYYRLQQTDKDGKFTYSPTQVVTLGITSLRMFPNPTSGSVIVEGNAAELRRIKVYSRTGQDVTGFIRMMSTGTNRVTIDLSGLAAGIYTITTQTSAGKIFKQ